MDECYDVSMYEELIMNIFLTLIFIAMLTVFSVDVRQKRREFLKQQQSTK